MTTKQPDYSGTPYWRLTKRRIRQAKQKLTFNPHISPDQKLAVAAKIRSARTLQAEGQYQAAMFAARDARDLCRERTQGNQNCERADIRS